MVCFCFLFLINDGLYLLHPAEQFVCYFVLRSPFSALGCKCVCIHDFISMHCFTKPEGIVCVFKVTWHTGRNLKKKKKKWYLKLLGGNCLCVVGSWFYLFLKWFAMVSTLDFITKMYLLITVKQKTVLWILYWNLVLFLKFLWVCRVVVNQVTFSFQTFCLVWTVEADIRMRNCGFIFLSVCYLRLLKSTLCLWCAVC